MKRNVTATRTAALNVLLAVVIPNLLLGRQQPDGWSSAWADVDSLFRGSIQREGIIGGSLAFVRDGKIVAHSVEGHADRATGRRVDEATIYHWASITKTFTAIAIMQLRDRGLIALDDPIVRYIPELHRVHNPFGSMEAITLRHLLSHSAGFRAPTWPWGGSEPWHPHEPTEWEQIVAMLPYTEIQFPPGTRYSYSNPGIIFLGRVIELVSGDDYEVYVEKNIFKPLGMHRSYFDRTPYHLLPDRSNNYFVEEGLVVANGLDFDTGITVSNGGLNAPLADMSRYLGFLTGAVGIESGGQVLSRGSLQEMWEFQHQVGEDDDIRTSIGLAFFRLEHDGRLFVGHTGGQQGFVSFIYAHPESGTAAVAAFNTLGIGDGGRAKPNTRAVLSDVRRALFDRIFPLFERASTNGRSR